MSDPNAECWEWKGYRTRDGYGQKRINGKKHQLHRLAYEWANGLFPKELLVLHRCDNPPCVNPNHLFLGTQADNVADRVSKGRSSMGVGRYNSKLTHAQILTIRAAKGHGVLARIAREFGISHSNAYRIRLGKAWKHVA